MQLEAAEEGGSAAVPAGRPAQRIPRGVPARGGGRGPFRAALSPAKLPPQPSISLSPEFQTWRGVGWKQVEETEKGFRPWESSSGHIGNVGVNAHSAEGKGCCGMVKIVMRGFADLLFLS